MPPDASTPAAAARPAVKILVAEDSPVNQILALKQLERLGYEARAVGDGTEVLTALKAAHYDIILMDCSMPEMSGYEATWQIRELEKPATDEGAPGRVYIIAMTANSDADNREKCHAAGMDDFIIKPVQLPELEAAIHRALADRASQQVIDEVIDPVIVAGLRDLRLPGRPDPLAELIDIFLREAAGQIDTIQQAASSRDPGAMSRALSHAIALKGGAGNLGARHFAALVDEAVQLLRAGLLSDAVPLIEKVREAFPAVRTALEKIKGGTPAPAKPG